jgi:hypothetical protein
LTDPLSENPYVYGVTIDQKYYQIGMALENLQANTLFVSQAYADSGHKAKVTGNYRGLFKYSGSIYNIPSLLINEVLGTLT